jgi:hypothetical protein
MVEGPVRRGEKSHQTLSPSPSHRHSSAFPFSINLESAQMLSFPTSFSFLFRFGLRGKKTGADAT